MLRLNAALEQWSDWGLPIQNKPEVIKPFKLGVTNQLYLLQASDMRMVLRLNNPESLALGINRKQEAAITAYFANKGLAPELYYGCPHYSYSVFEFIDGPTLEEISPAELPRWKTQQVELIEQLQQVKLNLPKFNYVTHLSNYWNRLPVQAKPANLSKLWKTFYKNLQEFQNSDWPAVVCHHDISLSNLIVRDNKLVLLDWEYAAMGHPAIDTYLVTGNTQNAPFVAELVHWMEKLWFMLAETSKANSDD